MSTRSASAAVSDLDELIDDLRASRERAASAFAAEVFFFDRVAGVVTRRERERAAAMPGSARTSASQLAMRELFAEIGAALRLSEWQVARKVSIASALMNEFHETLCDASCGQISAEHATVIAEIGIGIDDDVVRREYETIAREMAGEMTTGQLKPALSGLLQRLDTEAVERRVREAVQRRRVTVRELEPGLARITADVPTAQGVGIGSRLRDMATELLEQHAADTAAAASAADASSAAASPGARLDGDPTRHAGGRESGSGPVSESGPASEPGPVSASESEFAPDERTHAQLMADVFCDLLLTGAATGHGTGEQGRVAVNAIRASVQITIPATALAGRTVGGASIAGFGPVDDDTARHLAATAPVWTRIFTDPCRGVPISVDRYRPSRRQQRYLQARDEHCRFPGCRRTAAACDIDHTIAYADGGPTCLCNLAHLCRRHHTLKHDTDWTVQQLPGGILEWTAPTGRTHHTRPPGTVRFEPVALTPPEPHTHHSPPPPTPEPAPF